MNAFGGLIVLIIACAIVIAIFAIFRWLVLWYWRVNEAVELLTSINQKLGHILERTPEASRPVAAQSNSPQDKLQSFQTTA